MVATVWFVNYYLHNGDNDGWAYKVVGKYTSIDAAKKSYHSELSSYIGSTTYDNVAVTLTDSFGNTIMSEWWAKEEPEPNVEPGEE